MPSKTKVVTFARPVRTSQSKAFGLTAESENYGRVEIIRATITTHYRSDGWENKNKPEERIEEVLLEMDAEQAAHMLGTMASAVVESLTVTKGVF